MDIPTNADWDNWPPGVERPLDLDEEDARREFAGKSFEEALRLFAMGPVLMRSEDVGYMPPVPFRYYMLVFKAHVLASVDTAAADHYSDASDAASSFLHLVEHRLASDPDSIAPIMAELIPAIEFIAANQDRYDASRDIYGDFGEQVARIKHRWECE